MKQIHKIQLDILNKLIFSEGLKFSEMKDVELDNNQFTYHLGQLINLGYINQEGNKYKLTPNGKRYTNQMDTEKVTIKVQAKLSAWLVCTRYNNSISESEYLIYTRLKHPFYGCQGFPSGKIDYGETVTTAAKRELMEETGLSGEPQIVHLRHYLVRSLDGKELREDKFMFMCLFDDPTGELMLDEKEGKYEWVKYSQLKKYIYKHFESWDAFVEQLNIVEEFSGEMTFQELIHDNDKF